MQQKQQPAGLAAIQTLPCNDSNMPQQLHLSTLHVLQVLFMCAMLLLPWSRLDEALLQNAVADILADDLQLLGDEDGDGVPGSSRGAAGPAGTSGRQEHGGLTEAQSFTDLTYSKNKVGNQPSLLLGMRCRGTCSGLGAAAALLEQRLYACVG